MEDNIIHINEIKDRENEVFAIRDESGELKDIEDYNGDDWQNMFENAFMPLANAINVNPWEIFAQFISSVLRSEEDE